MLPLRMKTAEAVPPRPTPTSTSAPHDALPFLDPQCDSSSPYFSLSVDDVPHIRRNTCAVAIQHAAFDNTQLYLALLSADLCGLVNAYLLWRGWHTHASAKRVPMPEETLFAVFASSPSYCITDEGEQVMFRRMNREALTVHAASTSWCTSMSCAGVSVCF